MQQIVFEGIPVVIQRRLFQRSVNIIVDSSGRVKITAGKTTPVKTLIHFLEHNKAWVCKNIDKIKKEQLKHPPKLFERGEEFLFLGRRLPLDFRESPMKRAVVRVTEEKILIQINKDQVHCKPSIQKSMNRFYKKSGVEVLSKVIKEKSGEMNLFPTKLSFRAQKTRWGSCSSTGSISMNWKLIFAPPPVLEYVVIHELAHLKHQDHSQSFWQLVEKFSPDYRLHKEWLSRYSREIESYDFS